MAKEQFLRLSRLIGEENVVLLSHKCVSCVGVGAVGGFAIEALARSGVGKIKIFDFDRVAETNINRQIIALHSTIGMLKTDVMKKRLIDINPDIVVEDYPFFISDENHDIVFNGSDLVIDCIDSLKPKISLLSDAYNRNIPIISSMGAALRRDPTLVRYGDIMDSWGCPLARQVRYGLRKNGVKHGIKCVFSPEKVDFSYVDPEHDDKAERIFNTNKKRAVLGSLPTITAIFGEYMAHLALNTLLGNILVGKES